LKPRASVHTPPSRRTAQPDACCLCAWAQCAQCAGGASSGAWGCPRAAAAAATAYAQKGSSCCLAHAARGPGAVHCGAHGPQITESVRHCVCLCTAGNARVSSSSSTNTAAREVAAYLCSAKEPGRGEPRRARWVTDCPLLVLVIVAPLMLACMRRLWGQNSSALGADD
jgi:hypothetical protein